MISKYGIDSHYMERSGSVEKALDVLLHLHAEGPCALAEIGDALGLPSSTAHRLLASLGSRGLVERDGHGRYRPGMALVSLALAALQDDPLIAAARAAIAVAVRDLRETVLLSGARARGLTVLAVEEGDGFLRAAPRVGAQLPAHATAPGKLYLALAPGTLDLPDRGLPRFTLVTLGDGVDLQRELATVRERGWAASSDEWLPGLADIAAPVRIRGQLAGVLSVAGPTSRFQSARQESFLEHLLGAAERVARGLEGA